MRPWSIAWRLLLALGLVFNGGGSMALAHAFATPGAHAEAARAPAGSEHCHEHAASKPAEPKPAAPDCCQSGACRCACLHLAPLPVAALQVPPRIAHDRSVRPIPLGHRAPALPHLVRPPIGQA